jgi:hypothetical protein
MDWSDKRLVDEIPFAMGNSEQERAQADVRDTFKKAGCVTGDDIALVGCTGLAALGYDVTHITWIRKNMGGSGIGLTCFVPPTRFCFVHNTIGGLEDGQPQRNAEFVDKISRELSPAERTKVSFMDKVRRLKGKSKHETLELMKDVLGGKTMPDEVLEGLRRDLGEAEVEAAMAPMSTSTFDPNGVLDRPAVEMFTCPEHSDTVWSCRFCLAEAVAKGPYAVNLILAVAPEGTSVLPDTINNVAPDEVDDKIKYLDENNVDTAAVYVRAVRWSRRCGLMRE